MDTRIAALAGNFGRCGIFLIKNMFFCWRQTYEGKWNIIMRIYTIFVTREVDVMGLFSSSSNKGGVPSYLKKEYEKLGLDPDNEVKGGPVNQGS